MMKLTDLTQLKKGCLTLGLGLGLSLVGLSTFSPLQRSVVLKVDGNRSEWKTSGPFSSIHNEKERRLFLIKISPKDSLPIPETISARTPVASAPFRLKIPDSWAEIIPINGRSSIFSLRARNLNQTSMLMPNLKELIKNNTPVKTIELNRVPGDQWRLNNYPILKVMVFRLKIFYSGGLITEHFIIIKNNGQNHEMKVIGIIPAARVLYNSRGASLYRKVKMMDATAYYPGPECTGKSDGLTATGKKATYGIVAVDPRIIPLGSLLFVEGYGMAEAADVGGAIKGNRIDLCFQTYRQALNFGRKRVKVFILE